MDLAVAVLGNDAVHEAEEFAPSAPLGVPGRDLADGDVEGGEQRRGAVALVFVGMAGEGATIGQLEVAVRASSAWIEGFSSTESTSAFSGGSR